MNIQLDLFELKNDEYYKKMVVQQKIEYLATGKYLKGLKGNELWEAHEKKVKELFGKE